MIRPATLTALVVLPMALALAACDESASPPPETEPAPAATAERTFSGRVYERNFVFTTVGRDTAFVAPWLFRIRTRPGAVDRGVRVMFARGETWESVYEATWQTRPSRAPWRILPHGSLGLAVRVGDGIESLLFQEGPRALELELGEVLMEWTASGEEVFRLVDGALWLGEERVPGMALDMARTASADEPGGGDWAFLVSGDSLQVVVEVPTEGPPAPGRPARAWARLDFRELRWPEVTLEWAEVRSFQPARQDIPVSWSLTAEEGEVTGSLEVTSNEIRALDGPGPLLPVDALFGVAGVLTVEGGDYPVRGIVRHIRP